MIFANKLARIFNALALLIIVLFVASEVSASWRPRLQQPPAGTDANLLRSNINIAGAGNYMCIDHIRCGGVISPVGYNFGTGTPYWNTSILTAKGWPKIKTDSTRPWGGGFAMPSGYNFPGPYVMDDDGNGRGQIILNQGGLITDLGQSTNCSSTGGAFDRVTVTPGFRCVFTYFGPQTEVMGWIVSSNDPSNVGEFIQGLRFYRQSDEADLKAGRVFRREWVQTLVDLNPSLLRFMDLTGGNQQMASRWENRTKPEYASINYGNWLNSPPYEGTSGVNQYTLPAEAGTPVAMVHGEVATFRIENSIEKSGAKTILAGSTGITQAAVGVVTVNATTTGVGSSANGSDTLTGLTAAQTSLVWTGMAVSGTGIPASVTVVSKTTTTVTMSTGVGVTAGTGTTFTFTGHGYSNGDVVTFMIDAGMTQLNQMPVTVTYITPTTFSIGVDTSGFTTFTAGTVMPYLTLNIGGRGAYPVVLASGSTELVSKYSSGACTALYWCATNYQSVVFNSEMVASTAITGVWVLRESANTPSFQMWPIEIVSALVREANDISTRGPINIWINIPHMALLSVDPDYTAANNPAIQMVNHLLNGSAEYPALPSDTLIFIEFSNETWNCCNNTFGQVRWLARLGQIRYGGSINDFASYSTMRTVIMVNDVKTAFPNHLHRLRFVLAGQGALGMSGLNTGRIDGTAFYNADPWNIWAPAEPISHFYGFAWAAYIEPSPTYDAVNRAGLVNDFVAATTDAQRAVPVSTYVDNGMYATATGGSQTAQSYTGLIGTYATGLLAKSRVTFMYEGGWNPNVFATNGQFGETGTPGAISSGSDQVTGLSSSAVTGWSVGDYVTGDGITELTKITAKATTSITLSTNATATIASTKILVWTPTNYFMRTVQRSTQWANRWVAFFNVFNTTKGAFSPADYTQTGVRFGHAWPDPYVNGVFGAGFDNSWQFQSGRNTTKLPFLLKRDLDPAANDNAPMFLNQAA